MQRLVSICLEYENKVYNTLVSMRKQENDLCCQVRYIDRSLPYIMPGDVLLLNVSDGLKQPTHLPSELANSFVNCCTREALFNLKSQEQKP